MTHSQTYRPLSPALRHQWLRTRRILARAVVQAWAKYAEHPTMPNRIAALQAEQALQNTCNPHIPGLV